MTAIQEKRAWSIYSGHFCYDFSLCYISSDGYLLAAPFIGDMKWRLIKIEEEVRLKFVQKTDEISWAWAEEKIQEWADKIINGLKT